MSSKAQAVLESHPYQSVPSAEAILTPNNHDQLDYLYHTTLPDQLVFSEAGGLDSRAEHRSGPQRLSDLLDSSLEVHMKRAGDYIIVESAHSGFDNHASCCVSVWAWDESSLSLQRCFSQNYQFGVDSIALDSENGTLAIAADGSVSVYSSRTDTARDSFRSTGHFRLESVGFSQVDPELQFESSGVLTLHGKNSPDEPLKIAL